MEKVILTSGAELEITQAGAVVQFKLLQAVLNEVRAVDASALTSKTGDNLNFIKDLFCTFLCSEKILDALKPCLARTVYNGVKVKDINFFDDVRVMGDMLETLKEVARVNLAPFTKSLLLQLEEQGVSLGKKA